MSKRAARRRREREEHKASRKVFKRVRLPSRLDRGLAMTVPTGPDTWEMVPDPVRYKSVELTDEEKRTRREDLVREKLLNDVTCHIRAHLLFRPPFSLEHGVIFDAGDMWVGCFRSKFEEGGQILQGVFCPGRGVICSRYVGADILVEEVEALLAGIVRGAEDDPEACLERLNSKWEWPEGWEDEELAGAFR